MKYEVIFSVSGHCHVAVDAKNGEEARDLAEVRFSEMDFGELKNVEGEILYTEDEDGNCDYLW